MKSLESLLGEIPSAMDIRVRLKEVELEQQRMQSDLDVLANDRQLKEQEAIFARAGKQEVRADISRETKKLESECVLICDELRRLSHARIALTYLLGRLEVLEHRKDREGAQDLARRARTGPLQKAIDSAEIEDEAFRRMLEELLGGSHAGLSPQPESSTGVVAAATLAGKRESVLDRKAHLEADIITRVPEVKPWCDELSLNKRKINVGDCELYLEEEGEGIPLVLLSGGPAGLETLGGEPGGAHHCFHPWFSRARDYARIIYYDQRGCGLSSYEPGKDGYSIGQAAADLDAIRDALGIDRWVVLGHSYGGALAQYYLLKYPDRLAGLILVGATPGMGCDLKPGRQQNFFSVEEKFWMMAIKDRLHKLAGEELWPYEKYEELVVYNNLLNGDWKRQHFYRPSREDLARVALYQWKSDLKNNFRGRVSNTLHGIDMTGAFAGCPVPTLIMEGRWDLDWNDDKPDALANNHPGARLVRFENAGHCIFNEDSDAFFRTLHNFIYHLPAVPPAAVEACAV